MPIRFVFLFLLTFLSFFASAQDSLRMETIYLVDGSMLKVQILEQSEYTTKVKILSGDVLLLNNSLLRPKGEIPHFVKLRNRETALHEKGLYNILSLGLLAGRDAQLQEGLVTGVSALHYVVGHQFNQYIGVGGGLGLDFYDIEYLPAYVDLRGNMALGKMVFYYSMQAGYALSGDDFGGQNDVKNKGGLLVYPAVGIRLATQRNTDILLEFGYRNQWAKREYSWRENPDEIVYRRYAFRVGFAF